MIKTVGFLLLDAKHQTYHVGPIAKSLAKISGFKITIYTSNHEVTQLVKIIIGNNQSNCEVCELQPGLISLIKLKLKLLNFPSPSKLTKKYKSIIQKHDVVVSGDINLKYINSTTKTKTIFCFHGAGDREYPFNLKLNIFDLFLVSGNKYAKRLVTESSVKPEKIRITGYPKFDLIKHQSKKIFNNQRPTVIYNPHFEKTLSSWFDWGYEILEWFLKNKNFNLIFAPHIMLYKKKSPQQLIPKKFFNIPNIHIADSNDDRNINMGFLMAADIYLGDVSSQVYEFITVPRACVFLNSKNISWSKSIHYSHWNLGLVINSLSEFDSSINSYESILHKYKSIQEEYYFNTFSIEETPAAERAAAAIAKFCNK